MQEFRLLPVSYFLGYLAWAGGLLEFGLGNVAVGPNRYLELGVISSMLAATIFGTSVVAVLIWQWQSRLKHRITYLWLIFPLSGVVTVLGYFLILSMFGVFRLAGPGLWDAAIVGGTLVPLMAVTWFLLARGLQLILGTKRSLWPSGNSVPMTIPLLVALVWAGTIFPTSMMPHVNPEFGGLLPREAIIELSENASLLQPILNDDTIGPPTTKLLWILHHDSNGFLVRLHDDPRGYRDAPLYLIPPGIVQSVIWLD